MFLSTHLLAVDEGLEEFGVERVSGDFGSEGGGINGVVGSNLGRIDVMSECCRRSGEHVQVRW